VKEIFPKGQEKTGVVGQLSAKFQPQKKQYLKEVGRLGLCAVFFNITVLHPGGQSPVTGLYVHSLWT
jgi:hypothetical protein